jgi:hypothetical protein
MRLIQVDWQATMDTLHNKRSGDIHLLLTQEGERFCTIPAVDGTFCVVRFEKNEGGSAHGFGIGQ